MIPDAEFVQRVRALVAEYDAPPPPPPGPPTIHLTAGQDLQTALDTAPAGATLTLEAGATWYGRYVVRQPVRVTTRGEWGPGRISPDAAVAWLRSPGNEPALWIQSRDVKVSHLGIMGNDLPGTAVRVGSHDSPDWAAQPASVHLESVLIRVLDDWQLQRGIGWHGGPGGWILGCRIEGVKKLGQETQGIWINNCPGDLDVENNLFECASIGILVGGAPQYMSGGIPTGIRIRNNDLPKRPEWWTQNFVCKNAIELKCGVNVDITGNRGSHVARGGQTGYPLLLTVKDNGERSPWIRIANVLVARNEFTVCGAGVKLASVYRERQDDGTYRLIPSAGMQDIVIDNNLFAYDERIGADQGLTRSDGTGIYQMGPIPGLAVDSNTFAGTGAHWWYNETSAAGSINERAFIGRNVAFHGLYGFNGAGTTGHALNTLARYFPGAEIEPNVIAGGSASRYPAGTLLPSIDALLGQFMDVGAGDFRMRADGPYGAMGWRP